MIRFIDLTGQIHIDGEEKPFAFFDTVINKFCEFSGEQYWENAENFIRDFDGEDLKRFLILIPDSYPRKSLSMPVKLNRIQFQLNKKYECEKFYEIFTGAIPVGWMCGAQGKWQRIEYLEVQLKNALVIEDYLLASELKSKIEDLKK